MPGSSYCLSISYELGAGQSFVELAESDGGGFDNLELLQPVEAGATDLSFFDEFFVAHEDEDSGRVAAAEFAALNGRFSFHF